MHIFEKVSQAQIFSLVQSNPLAWIVPATRPDLAQLMPVLFEDQSCQKLFGHLPLHWTATKLLEENGDAVCLYLGAHSYIDPSLVSDPDWVPTWNFQSISFDGTLIFRPDKTREFVDRLVDRMQEKSTPKWTTTTVEHRMPRLLDHIIGFEFAISSTRPRFKLGQDETDQAYLEIVSSLLDQDIVDAMREARGL